MATAAPTTEFEDLTTCAVCLETFTRPKVLPCQHSFCYACLMLLGKDKTTITCPYCQEEHGIPASGVSGFKDSWILNNLVGMSLPKSEVCTDCKERPSVPDECEHCGEKICHKCLVEHAKLSTEVSNSLCQLEEYLTTSTSENKKIIIDTFRANLRQERRKLNETFRSEAVNKLVETRTILERLESIDSLVNIIDELYDILGSEDNASKRYIFISELSKRFGECKYVDSMKELKRSMADIKTLLRLILTNDDEFKFRYSTSPLEGSGQLEFGQAVVNVTGKYRTLNIVDQILLLVLDSAETLSKYVKPTFSNIDHVVSVPSTLTPADVVTEIEGRFPDYVEDPKHIVGQNSVAKHSTTYASDPPASSKVPKYRQNELPRHVDYTSKCEGIAVVIGSAGDLRYPHGCAYHVGRDEIFVADSCNHRIMAFSSNGTESRVFYVDVRYPRDVAVSSDGKHVYIAAGDRVIKVDMDGRHVNTIRKFSLGVLKVCWSISCHREVTTMIESNHKCVIVFNNRDEELNCFGNDHLTAPVSVAVSVDGLLFYVTNDKSSCVKVFHRSGQYLETFAKMSSFGDISGIAVDSDGNVCVARCESHSIDVYDSQNELITSIGGHGSVDPVSTPCGLCLTPDGKLLVVDRNNHLVQIY